MLNSTFTKLALAGTVSLLVACGGGGGGSKPKSSSSAAPTQSSSSVVTTSSSEQNAGISSSSEQNPGEPSSSSSTQNPGEGSSSSSDNTPGESSSSSDNTGSSSSNGGVVVPPSSSSEDNTPSSSSSSVDNTPSSSSSSIDNTPSSSSSSVDNTPSSSSSSVDNTPSSSSSSVDNTPSSSSSSIDNTPSSSSSSVDNTPSSSSSSVDNTPSSSSSSVDNTPSSSSSSDSNPGSSSSASSVDQGAVDIVDDEKTYDGEIPLDETKVIGTPGADLQTTGNPFKNSYFYLSPDIKTMMDASIKYIEEDDSLSETRKKDLINKTKFVQRQPSAVWMDSTATIYGDPEAGRRSLLGHLDAAVAQQKFYEQKDGKLSPMTIVIIVYNLPDRDCAAFASNGQLYEIGKPKNWEGTLGGMQKYKEEYLGKIVSDLTAKPEYSNLRIVAMLEPDSYPNMITNVTTELPSDANTNLYPDRKIGPSIKFGDLMAPGYSESDKYPVTYCDTILKNYTAPGLADGLGVYGHGLQIAINELYKAGQKSTTGHNVYTYLDIGHSGWLGWDSDYDPTDPTASADWDNDNYSNLKRGVRGFLTLIRGANEGGVNGFEKVRGFASNTSGYSPTEEPAISNLHKDRGDLASFYEYNKSVDEVSFLDNFNRYLVKEAASENGGKGFAPGYIIDTARNGWGGPNRPTIHNTTRATDVSKRIDKRNHRGHWCNVDKAGVGEVPKPNPDASRPFLDTFFWMKPPGESDGISFDHKLYAPGTANWDKLDDIDRAIVKDAALPKYDGKMLDTMCIEGSKRDGYIESDPSTHNILTAPVKELAPHAGGWFHKQFIMLIDNAHPALGTSEYEAH